VSERSVVRVDTDLPAAQLSVIGCAVLTGAGAVFNIADVGAGTSLLVVGAGGIGLAAIQAGRALGAHPIAAIDPSDAARAAALRAGATIACDPGDTQLLLAVTDSRGFDVAIDCVSTGATLDVTWPLTRRGGEIVLVGVTASSEQFPFAPIDVVLSGRRLTGCVYGGSSIHRDIPRYVRLAEAGKLDLAALIGRTVSLQDVPELLLHGPIGPGRTIVR
jgi:S-(hydroxymethyl)glutathione dehydrogenase/alcohol dehydrogenase